MGAIRQAFVLGAGLGTRLRPLTETLPKPLVPVRNRPLIHFALDHLLHDLGIESFAVNTHHCPEAYRQAFPDGTHQGRPVLFRHEPVLLDTGGGIDNLRDWLPRDQSFVVYNGDILTDLPLAGAVAEHHRRGDLVTMVLRSEGDEKRVGWDPGSGAIVDLRGLLNPDWPHRYQFTGIYLVAPAFLEFLEPGRIESVILPMVRAITAGAAIGGVVVDEGEWSDLGERGAYLEALSLFERRFPRYRKSPEESFPRISPEAEIAAAARIDRLSTVGPGAKVGPGAEVRHSVLWPGAVVEGGACLERVVVRGGQTASGRIADADL